MYVGLLAYLYFRRINRAYKLMCLRITCKITGVLDFVHRSLSSVVLINNKAFNTHAQPEIFFSSLGPHTEH
jgi:hypothetical protein